jgi:hypothetical protein
MGEKPILITLPKTAEKAVLSELVAVIPYGNFVLRQENSIPTLYSSNLSI